MRDGEQEKEEDQGKNSQKESNKMDVESEGMIEADGDQLFEGF